MENKIYLSAIIVAAGSSSRMGKNINKQLIEIGNKPVIAHSIGAFQNSYLVNEIILVCKDEHVSIMRKIVRDYNFSKVKSIVPGGKTRQISVFNGIKELSDKSKYILIHDGVRAMIREDVINEAIIEAQKYEALALAVPVKDTIKIVDGENFVNGTPERDTLWAVQTPQIFEKNLYVKAMNDAEEKMQDYTDDCQLIENIGVKVKIFMGSYDNIKITTPEDIYIAETIIKNRRK